MMMLMFFSQSSLDFNVNERWRRGQRDVSIFLKKSVEHVSDRPSDYGAFQVCKY